MRPASIHDIAARAIRGCIGLVLASGLTLSPETVRAAPQSPEIAGGGTVSVRAWRNNYRWMVGLLYRAAADDLRYVCQGTLINRQWVLTAANCIYRNDLPIAAEDMKVAVNSRRLSNAGQRDVEQIVVHPRFARNFQPGERHLADDIALVKLATPMPAQFPIVRLKDAVGERDPWWITDPGTTGRIVGWGQTDFDDPGSLSDLLQHGVATIRERRLCRLEYRTDFTRRSLCADAGRRSGGICPGDWGGPLIVQAEDEWVQVGIASGARDCPQTGSPAVYTRISTFRDWINPIVRPKVEQISAGQYHTCAIDEMAQAWCWGDNWAGQLGNGDGGQWSDKNYPVRVKGLSNALAIDTSHQHSCGINSRGVAFCWGRGDHGELGNGTAEYRYDPTRVADLPRVTAISAGSQHSCAVTRRKRALCWGENRAGQLGDGSTLDSLTPVRVVNLPRARTISTARDITCAITPIGRAKCWGWNRYGQLGDGTTDTRATPTRVAGFARVTGLEAGWLHGCAIPRRGRTRCWGYNADGQLGDGTTINRLRPVTVSSLVGVKAIAGALGHSCAITRQGRAMCWGDNSIWNQLGDGTSEDRLTPVPVANMPKAKAITAGRRHSCAITEDGLAMCWGDNAYGQVGVPDIFTDYDHAVPVNFPIR